jgi:uncharacterized phage protein gp47/JayE
MLHHLLFHHRVEVNVELSEHQQSAGPSLIEQLRSGETNYYQVSPASPNASALHDYHTQLMVLERQNLSKMTQMLERLSATVRLQRKATEDRRFLDYRPAGKVRELQVPTGAAYNVTQMLLTKRTLSARLGSHTEVEIWFLEL